MEIIQYIGLGIGMSFLIPLIFFALLLIVCCIPSLILLIAKFLKPLLIIAAITVSILIILQVLGYWGGDSMKSYEELEKENAELKRQLEERQIIYEPIANEIIEIFAKYRIEFEEVTGLLELVKLKCQHQNSSKFLE